ncbi:MAG TPA: hypothetical protein VMW79_07905 [Anaerolineae bacterium]|nr:hypothetical protein [Anaerolineae bacterium]
MQSVVMEKGSPHAWMLMPAFRARVMEFDRRYCVDGNATNIANLFETCFAAGDPRMLGLALMEVANGDVKMVGHLIAGVDTYHGVSTAVIYQYEKDNFDEDVQGTNDLVQSVVDTWALGLGLHEVSALATSQGRAKHFERWGYRYSATLVTRRIGHGGQE